MVGERLKTAEVCRGKSITWQRGVCSLREFCEPSLSLEEPAIQTLWETKLSISTIGGVQNRRWFVRSTVNSSQKKLVKERNTELHLGDQNAVPMGVLRGVGRV